MALQTKYLTANGSNGHHKFTLTVNEDSTNINNNTSSISWVFQIDAIQAGWKWSYTNSVNYSVVINGTEYSGVINNYDGSSTVAIRNGTEVITHNTDGNKTINYSFSISSLNINYLPGSASASGSMALTTIPRAATITAAPNFNDEGNPTITYSNPAGTAVSSLQACITDVNGGGYVGYRDISKTGTSYTFNLTDAERNALRNATPNSNTFTVKFYVRTQLGGTYYYSSITKTMSIVNANPTVSTASFTDKAGFGSLTGSTTNRAIKSISVIEYELAASAKKGATIKSYSITNGNNTSSNSSGTFWNITNPTFNYTITDSRGNKVSGTKTFTMVDYVLPSCNLVVAAPTTSGTMGITISGNYYNGSFGATNNSITVWYRYKTNNGSFGSWQTLTPTISGNTYKATKSITGLNYLNSYTVEACVEDSIFVDGNYKGAIYSEAVKVKTTPVFDWSEEDFNFNVPVAIQGNTINDFVVEQGTKDRWIYRKWNSGIAECWGTSDSITAEVSGTWGTISGNTVMYAADNVVPQYNLPFTFAAAPTFQVSFETGG